MGLFGSMSFVQIMQKLQEYGFEGAETFLAIDATQSNTWNGKDGSNLHDITQGENQYQFAIGHLGKCLKLDGDHKYTWGVFGEKYTGNHSFAFMSHVGKEPTNVQEVLDHYTRVAMKLQYSGTTNFAPAINACIQRVRSNWKYTVLILLCDGAVTNDAMEATKGAIVEASHYPISIVCLGVGCNEKEFKTMDGFDKKVKGQQFDNFQFVEVQDLLKKKDADEALARQALKELPKQYKTIRDKGLLQKPNTMRPFGNPSVVEFGDLLGRYKNDGLDIN